MTSASPAARPLTRDLTDAIENWTTCQRTVVGLAADFASAITTRPRTRGQRHMMAIGR